MSTDRRDMPEDDGSLSLREVRERFEQSANALDEIQRRLTELDALRERRASALERIESSDRQIDTFTSEAAGAVEALQAAQRTAASAFESMRAIVDGSDLRRIAEEVASIREKQDELARSLDDGRRLQREKDELAGELASARTELDRVTSDFERLRNAASGRVLRKAGLEPSGSEGGGSG